MVDIKVTRDYVIDGDNYIAIKRSEYTNAKGKKCVQVVEEHSITLEEVNEVLDKYVPEEIEKLQTERDDLEKQLSELQEEAVALESEEYKRFKEYLELEETKANFDLLSKEKGILSAKNRLNELDKTKEDILNWEGQFKSLKNAIDNGAE